MMERQILMTPENAQKCHDGAKTQTRRILKNQPGKFVYIEYDERKGWQYWWDVGVSGMPDVTQEYAPLKCPYGQVVDRLWVREPFAWPGEEVLLYRGCPADSEIVEKWKQDKNCPQVKWTPSIHMPKWACRTWLEITEIRVQRVQEISEEDCIAEGINRIHHGRGFYYYSALRDEPHPKNFVDPEYAYKELWESINGPGSWDANPWVWAISFRKVQP